MENARPQPPVDRARLATRLVQIGRDFHRRGWVLGTSGNFSVVTRREPLELLGTPSGADKGALEADRLVTVDGQGACLEGSRRASAEIGLHLAVVRSREAGAVLHTHSVAATLVSDRHAAQGGVAFEGWEMQKGLSGVATHEHREWLPILENSQDYETLAPRIEELLRVQPDPHGFLLRRHGLYTWGRDLEEAIRHVEVLEFLLEVHARSTTWPP